MKREKLIKLHIYIYIYIYISNSKEKKRGIRLIILAKQTESTPSASSSWYSCLGTSRLQFKPTSFSIGGN